MVNGGPHIYTGTIKVFNDHFIAEARLSDVDVIIRVVVVRLTVLLYCIRSRDPLAIIYGRFYNENVAGGEDNQNDEQGCIRFHARPATDAGAFIQNRVPVSNRSAGLNRLSTDGRAAAVAYCVRCGRQGNSGSAK